MSQKDKRSMFVLLEEVKEYTNVINWMSNGMDDWVRRLINHLVSKNILPDQSTEKFVLDEDGDEVYHGPTQYTIEPQMVIELKKLHKELGWIIELITNFKKHWAPIFHESIKDETAIQSISIEEMDRFMTNWNKV